MSWLYLSKGHTVPKVQSFNRSVIKLSAITLSSHQSVTVKNDKIESVNRRWLVDQFTGKNSAISGLLWQGGVRKSLHAM